MSFYHSSKALRLDEEILVQPTELVAGGASLSRVDGLPVFVMGLFPGDEAVVRITEVKRGFARGEVVRIVKESNSRRIEPCPVAGECGGCDWTALRLDYQLEAKRTILLESLRRIGRVDLAGLPAVTIHSSPLNYRLRSRLQVQKGQLGFFALRSHRVVPLPEECEVVGPAVAKHLGDLRGTAQQVGDGEIQTLETSRHFTTTVSSPQSLVPGPTTHRQGTRDQGPGTDVDIEVTGFRYTVSTETFFQVNRHLLPTLLRLVTAQVTRLPQTRRAFDLYSGVGFFSLPLAKRFKEVLAVEASAISNRYAARNTGPFRNVKLVRSSVEDFLARAPQEVDFVLVDPPRAGVSPVALNRISDTTCALLGYLSCDPVTFSRDVSRLVRRGWSLASLDLVDLFPNTHHVETFASFRREGSRSS